MAKSSTERMREKKERERKEQLVSAESTLAYQKRLFSDVWEEHAGFSDFEIPLELAGIEPPTFEDESNPEDKVKNGEALGVEYYGVENLFQNRKGSIGRAELTISCLLDAAIELAVIVNGYKRREITTRLAELEKAKNVDKSKMINEAIHLNKILESLDKSVRITLPKWEVKDV